MMEKCSGVVLHMKLCAVWLGFGGRGLLHMTAGFLGVPGNHIFLAPKNPEDSWGFLGIRNSQETPDLDLCRWVHVLCTYCTIRVRDVGTVLYAVRTRRIACKACKIRV